MGNRTGADLDLIRGSSVDVMSHVAGGRVRVLGKLFTRGEERMRIQGLTYGPFAPSAQGQPFPAPIHVRDDLARMQSLGANSIRTYHVPPDWVLDLVDDSGMTILMDIPWSTHVRTIGTRAGTQSRTGHSA